jgi:hypothetical protein
MGAAIHVKSLPTGIAGQASACFKIEKLGVVVEFPVSKKQT